MLGTLRVLLCLTASLGTLVQSISPVEAKGAKLFTVDDGNQFFVKGTLRPYNIRHARLTKSQESHTREAGPHQSSIPWSTRASASSMQV